jgi:hypothetical protein
MQDMPLGQVVNIFSGYQVDPLVPMHDGFPELLKLG